MLLVFPRHTFSMYRVGSSEAKGCGQASQRGSEDFMGIPLLPADIAFDAPALDSAGRMEGFRCSLTSRNNKPDSEQFMQGVLVY